jgi:predicted DCC family thiol-disulfide oxidoreductase YuxK
MMGGRLPAPNLPVPSLPVPSLPAPSVILFDGICVLCSAGYRFVTARDLDRRYRFVAIQSAEGRALAAANHIDPDDPSTFILIGDGKTYTRSDAALRILSSLPWWSWTKALRIVPERWRDAVYDMIARNRYRWFGKRDTCLMPDPTRVTLK